MDMVDKFFQSKMMNHINVDHISAATIAAILVMSILSIIIRTTLFNNLSMKKYDTSCSTNSTCSSNDDNYDDSSSILFVAMDCEMVGVGRRGQVSYLIVECSMSDH